MKNVERTESEYRWPVLAPFVVNEVAERRVQLLVVRHGNYRHKLDAVRRACLQVQGYPRAQNLDRALLRMLKLDLVLQQLLVHVVHLVCEDQLILLVLKVADEFLVDPSDLSDWLEQGGDDELLKRFEFGAVQNGEVERPLVHVVDAFLVQALDQALDPVKVLPLVTIIDRMVALDVPQVVDVEIESALNRPGIAFPSEQAQNVDFLEEKDVVLYMWDARDALQSIVGVHAMPHNVKRQGERLLALR